jgi:hypothetical protein
MAKRKDSMKKSDTLKEGFLSDNVVELGQHSPSVDSVIFRLNNIKSEIEHISIVVRWKDGLLTVAGNEMPLTELSIHAHALDSDVISKMRTHF